MLLAGRAINRELQPGRVSAASVRHAQTTRSPAQLQPFIRFLLLLSGDQRLARIAALPNAGLGDELRPAAAALFCHGFFQRKNPGLLWQ